MERHDADKFLSAVEWKDYREAAVAFAALDFHGRLRNLACRITLTRQGVGADWPRRAGVDQLHLVRDSLSTATIGEFLSDMKFTALRVGDVDLCFDFPESQPYRWGLQDFYPNVEQETGWPGQRLFAQSGYQLQLFDSDLLRKLERRLPSASGGQFMSWRAAGLFLVSAGQPLRLGDSEPLTIDIVAPAPVRFGDVDFPKNGTLGVSVESDTDALPASFCVDVSTLDGSQLMRLGPEDGQFADRFWRATAALSTVDQALVTISTGGSVVQKKTVRREDLVVEAPERVSRGRIGWRSKPGAPNSRLSLLNDLHSSVVARCTTAFQAGLYDDAIFNAFKAVEDALRTRTGAPAEKIGLDLVNLAFAPKSARLIVGVTEAERRAIHALFSGAIGSQKNPHSHRFVGVSDPIVALEALAFASLLLRIVDDARDSSVSASVITGSADESLTEPASAD